MANQRPQPPARRHTFDQPFNLAFDAVVAVILTLLSTLLRGVAWLLQRPSSRD